MKHAAGRRRVVYARTRDARAAEQLGWIARGAAKLDGTRSSQAGSRIARGTARPWRGISGEELVQGPGADREIAGKGAGAGHTGAERGI
jgi:hypothetical protein